MVELLTPSFESKSFAPIHWKARDGLQLRTKKRPSRCRCWNAKFKRTESTTSSPKWTAPSFILFIDHNLLVSFIYGCFQHTIVRHSSSFRNQLVVDCHFYRSLANPPTMTWISLSSLSWVLALFWFPGSVGQPRDPTNTDFFNYGIGIEALDLIDGDIDKKSFSQDYWAYITCKDEDECVRVLVTAFSRHDVVGWPSVADSCDKPNSLIALFFSSVFRRAFQINFRQWPNSPISAGRLAIKGMAVNTALTTWKTKSAVSIDSHRSI